MALHNIRKGSLTFCHCPSQMPFEVPPNALRMPFFLFKIHALPSNFQIMKTMASGLCLSPVPPVCASGMCLSPVSQPCPYVKSRQFNSLTVLQSRQLYRTLLPKNKQCTICYQELLQCIAVVSTASLRHSIPLVDYIYLITGNLYLH